MSRIIPSRLYEGDSCQKKKKIYLPVLVNLIGKMENEIKELNIALASLAGDVLEGSRCSSSVQPTLPAIVNNGSRCTGLSSQSGIPVCASVDSNMTSGNLVRQPGNSHTGWPN